MRTVFRLQVNDQLTIEEIGAFYAVSRATAARHLAEARAQLVAGTHQRLAATLGISHAELGELMRLVAIDACIRRCRACLEHRRRKRT